MARRFGLLSPELDQVLGLPQRLSSQGLRVRMTRAAQAAGNAGAGHASLPKTFAHRLAAASFPVDPGPVIAHAVMVNSAGTAGRELCCPAA